VVAVAEGCYNAAHMADWRQIQARIRKAKNSSDPPGQLAELYQRTRDAMVAFELAQWHEKAGDGPAAAQWYTSAAERFRRAQWRTKAEEALTRLGAPVPPKAGTTAQAAAAEPNEGRGETVDEGSAPSVAETEDEAAAETSAESSALPTEGQAASSAPESAAGELQKRKRRRGRRGGRGRRGKGGRVANDAAAGSAQPATRATARPVVPPAPQPVHEEQEPEFAPRPTPERDQQPAAAASWQSRTRTGDPALASRISQLESQLRRLLACPHASLDEAEQAPAGPGVLVLSDSDQITHYYVEACQTLRIGIGNLIRGGRGDSIRLKERMAENLGIAESRVAKYLKDHCSVRWLQLDEGARELAHFAISVLRPAVNE
jgi:hypothetical protein